MAYRRSVRRAPARRRPTRKNSSYKSRRSYTAKRRFTRRKRGMSRKTLLNVTSRKKQDTMLGYSNLANDPTDGSNKFHSGAGILKGGRMYIIPWIATARDLSPTDGTLGTVAQKASRTSTECFMRGLRERIQIQTNNGTSWQWRRICFTFKGPLLVNATTGSETQRYQIETNQGMARVMSDFALGTAADPLNGVLFKGLQSVDWSSYFTAKTDNSLVNIMYDQTRIISSGNASGVMRNYKLWHPMNKNIYYNEDEIGATTGTSVYSTSSKRGMGDYYVVDFILAGTGSNINDLMSFEPDSTLYWHER